MVVRSHQGRRQWCLSVRSHRPVVRFDHAGQCERRAGYFSYFLTNAWALASSAFPSLPLAVTSAAHSS